MKPIKAKRKQVYFRGRIIRSHSWSRGRLFHYNPSFFTNMSFLNGMVISVCWANGR